MQQTFNEQLIAQVKTVLSTAKKIVIVAHKSPDGDSVGSSLGLYHYLIKKGWEVHVCHPDPAPYFLEWMTGSDIIKNEVENNDEVHSIIAAADVIFCLDFNTMSRTGNLQETLISASATKIMIDHHLDPSDEFDFVFSEITACSTAQLIFDFIVGMGDAELLDRNIGEAL